jgi:hypothetical protein
MVAPSTCNSNGSRYIIYPPLKKGEKSNEPLAELVARYQETGVLAPAKTALCLTCFLSVVS